MNTLVLLPLLLVGSGALALPSFGTQSKGISFIDGQLDEGEIESQAARYRTLLSEFAGDEGLPSAPEGYLEALSNLSNEAVIEIGYAQMMSLQLYPVLEGENVDWQALNGLSAYSAENAVIAAWRYENLLEDGKAMEDALPEETDISYISTLQDIYLDCYADLFGRNHDKEIPGSLSGEQVVFPLTLSLETLSNAAPWLSFASSTLGEMSKNLVSCSLGYVEAVVQDYYEIVKGLDLFTFDSVAHEEIYEEYSFRAFEASFQELGLQNLDEAYKTVIGQVMGIARAKIIDQYEKDAALLSDVGGTEELLCQAFRYLLENTGDTPTMNAAGGALVLPEDHEIFHQQFFLPAMEDFRNNESRYPSVSLADLKEEFVRRIREPYKLSSNGSTGNSISIPSFTLWTLLDIIVISVFFGGMAIAGIVALITLFNKEDSDLVVEKEKKHRGKKS